MLVEYKHTPMKAFYQMTVGRFRLYCAAVPDRAAQIEALFRTNPNLLGQQFIVKPIREQEIGEEIYDGGRLIAVFGVVLTNAFQPKPQLFQEYQQELSKLILKQNK